MSSESTFRDRSLTRLLPALARLWPISVRVEDDFERAFTYLGWTASRKQAIKASRGIALLFGIAGTVAFGFGNPLAGSVLLVIACAVERVGARGPIWIAALRRTAALGSAPALISYAVLYARITPTAESAAAFAAQTGDGPLAESLTAHVRRAQDDGHSGFGTFGDEWAPWFPELRRATMLIEMATDAPAGRRDRTLDRAMDAVTDGTRDRMAGFTSDVRGPATALYAFGVVLPLALIGVLPAARVAGAPITLHGLTVVYVGVLPTILIVAGSWLLVHRPVAFPPPTVGRTHPDVPGPRTTVLTIGGSIAAAILAGAASAVLVAAWTWPIALAGAGAGIALRTHYRPIVAIHDRTRDAEEGLPDALYLLGRRIRDGTAPEAALAAIASEVTGTIGDVLTDAAGVQRRLGVGIETAFLGEYGAISALPSPRMKAAATLLDLTVSEGRPAGVVVVATANHLDELQAVERDARENLSSVTDTLRNTAAVFGPLVAGATVALADGMTGVGTQMAGAQTGTPLSTEGLGLVVGTYTLLLAAILATVAVALERGFDRAVIGERVGTTMLTATAIYLISIALTGSVL